MADIFDENVLIVANDLSRASQGIEVLCPEASDHCRLACAERLQIAAATGGVGLDDGTEYFDKYRSHCAFEGQPGVGDAFLRVVFERGYTEWAERIRIRDESNEFLLPAAILSSKFDPDDFLWLAGVLNAKSPSQIVNAVDSDYREHAALLAAHGIEVDELCE